MAPLGESLLSSSRSPLVLLDVTAQVLRMESTSLPRRAGAGAGAGKGRGPGGGARMEIERWMDLQAGWKSIFPAGSADSSGAGLGHQTPR